MRRFLALTGILSALALSTGSASAGNLYLSMSLQGSRALDYSDVEGDGGGAEFTVGYFFTPYFSLELAGLVSYFENDLVEGTLGGASLNARFSPLPHERVQPYLKGGVGAYFLEDRDYDEGLAGPGLNLGGGVEVFLMKGFSIGAEGTWRFINYTSEYYNDWGDPEYYDLEDDLDGTTFSGGLTLTWHLR